MKIALVDPPGTSRGLNTGLAYIAGSILEKHLCESLKVFDFNNSRSNTTQRLSEIGGYDIIAFSIKSFTQGEAFSLMDKISFKEEAVVVFGGPHLSIVKEEFLKKDRRINAVLIGECENTFCRFLEWVKGKMDVSEVRGLAVRNGRDISYNGDVAIEEDLDSLPFPSYEVFDSVSGRIDNYPLLTSRGCPYCCIYCSVGNISGRKWRSRSVGSVIRELKAARMKFGFNYFYIIDDNFTFEKERAKEFCRAIIAERMGLCWTVPNGIRADRIDEELMGLMKSSGCEAISFGVESADPEVFKNIGKGETLEDIARAVKLAGRFNLKVNGKFIIGLPGSSHKSTELSVRWAKKVGFYEINWNLLVPYPGTEAYEFIKRKGHFIRPWEEGFHFGPSPRSTFETGSYSAREMERDCRWANVVSSNLLTFYDFRKGVMWNGIRIFFLILRYDPWHMTSHLLHIISRWKRRQKRFAFD